MADFNEYKEIRPLKQNKNWRYTGMVQKATSSAASSLGAPAVTSKAVRVRLRAPPTTLKRMSREPNTKKTIQEQTREELDMPLLQETNGFLLPCLPMPTVPL